MNSLLKGFEQVPPSFEVLAELCALLHNPYVELPSVSHLIKVDVGLASAVLRLSNCAYYGARSPATDIEEALSRVGLTEVVKLVGLLSRRSLSSPALACYGLDSDGAWRQSLAVAVLMEFLACKTNEDPGLAYLTGLLHGIGKYPIARLMHRVKPSIVAPPGAKLADLARWEREETGTDYARTGTDLLQYWGFNTDIIEPITGHIHPFLAARSRKLACLLHICCHIAPCIVDDTQTLQDVEIPAGILRTAAITDELIKNSIEPAKIWVKSLGELFESELVSA